MREQLEMFDIEPTIQRSERVVNVASVPQRSPFRYPGGKTWLIPMIRKWLYQNNHQVDYLIEPFAGGGIVSLTAAFENFASSILMVEKDEEIAAVWESLPGLDKLFNMVFPLFPLVWRCGFVGIAVSRG